MSISCIDFPVSSISSFVGADNGVSIDPITGNVVWGNDIGGTGAELLSNREIEMDNFLFQLLNSGNKQFLIDSLAKEYKIGDIDNAANGMKIAINDPAQRVTVEDLNGAILMLDRSAGQYKIGDVSNVVNNTHLEIDDINKIVTIIDAGGTWLRIDNNLGEAYFGDFDGLSYNSLLSLSANLVRLYTSNVAVNLNETNLQVSIDGSNGLLISNDFTLIHTGQNLSDASAGATATLTNSPTAGNPAKWIAIDDNGTMRYIPTWL